MGRAIKSCASAGIASSAIPRLFASSSGSAAARERPACRSSMSATWRSHAAHQNGVDVDVWFTLDPKPALPPLARENVDLPSMLLADRSAVDPTRFGERQVRLLRLAATDPQVDRIFVHPLIKRALCRGEFGAGTGDRSWLRRLRPWYGHDDHFHVRLVCPPGSPDCRQQPPVPPGEGCDAAVFEWWAVELAKPKAPPPLPHAPPPLPAACHALETPE